jgi:hypothetical protein
MACFRRPEKSDDDYPSQADFNQPCEQRLQLLEQLNELYMQNGATPLTLTWAAYQVTPIDRLRVLVELAQKEFDLVVHDEFWADDFVFRLCMSLDLFVSDVRDANIAQGPSR